VGFHDYEACAAVCPVDCCVTDPNNIETEAVLISRARSLHQDVDFGENFQSRFRKVQGEEKAATVREPAAASAGPRLPAAEQKAVPPPKPVATAVPAKPAALTAAPKPTPPAKKETRPKKTFPSEVAVSFQEISAQYKSRGFLSSGISKLLVILSQPLLGALPHETKKRIEEAVQSPYFTAAGSTGLNIVHNVVLYPLICIAVAAFIHGSAILFSQEINIYVLVGILLAVAEGVFRLRDGIFRAKPAEEMIFYASLYGVPLGIVVQPVLEKQAGVIREVPVPVDGFYSKGFVEKLERERRYGNVYTMEDRGGAYFLRMEFPRWVPDIGLANRSQLPEEMPDYDYELALKDGHFIVKGKCIDERVRKVSSSIGAFPPEFTTIIPLKEKVSGFAQHFENKLLEVILLKNKGGRSGSSYR
jgi:hypothetical protein